MIVPVAIACPSEAAPGGVTPVKTTSKVSSPSCISSWTVATRIVCRVVPVANSTVPALTAVKSLPAAAFPTAAFPTATVATSTVFQWTITPVRSVRDNVTANAAIPPSSTVAGATDTLTRSGSGGSPGSGPSAPPGASGVSA